MEKKTNRWRDFRDLAGRRHALHYLRFSLNQALDRSNLMLRMEDEHDDLLLDPFSVQLHGDTLDQFEKEMPNILHGIQRFYDTQEWDLLIGSVSSVSSLLFVRGHWDKMLKYLELGLKVAQQNENTRSVAEHTYFLGILALRKGDHFQAKRMFHMCHTIYQNLNDKIGIAYNTYQHGVLAHLQENYLESRQIYEDSLEMFRQIRDKRGISSCLNGLGTIHLSLGNYVDAAQLYEASLNLKTEIGDQRSIAHTTYQLASHAYYQGDFERSQTICEQALHIKTEIGYTIGTVRSLYQLGVILQAKGDVETALSLYEKSLNTRAQLSDQLGMAIVIERLGSLQNENLEKAERLFLRASELYDKTENKIALARSEFNLGLILERQNRYKEAHKAYTDAFSIFTDLDLPEVVTARESLRRVGLWQAITQYVD